MKYKNPPLAEAVFEIFFHSKEWSAVIPGLFYSKVQKRFPKLSKNQNSLGISLDNKGIKIGTGSSEIIQYKNENEDTLVQLSSNMFSVNKLPKYKNWESYSETICFALESLREVLGDIEITRIGLKSINKIDIEEHSYKNIKKNFTIYPTIPQGITNDFNSLQLNIETQINNGSDVLALFLASLKNEPKSKAPILLQLYVLRLNKIEYKDIDTWLNQSHDILTNAFENSLTEQCKKKFNDVKESDK